MNYYDRVGVVETKIDTNLVERKLSKCMYKSSSALYFISFSCTIINFSFTSIENYANLMLIGSIFVF